MRDLSRTMKVVLGGAAAIGVALGAGGIASAVGGSTPSSAEADSAQEPSYTSSVTVADTQESGSEADESSALASLATITADEARAAALAAVPGTAGEVELENENGNVVYGVEVKDASGASYDVKVDAGNGAVLAQESDDEGDHEGDDQGDEGSETNDDGADDGSETDAGQ
jgi:uncharacterized membrane protein YkoI